MKPAVDERTFVAAVVTIPVVLTVFMHIGEWFIQAGFDKYYGTKGKTTAVLISILGSVISAVFNLFAMRRGILLVKDESQQSFWRDIKQMRLYRTSQLWDDSGSFGFW